MQNSKTPQQILEQLLAFIDDEKINVKVEALKTFISLVQSDIAYVNLIENQYKKAIISLTSLIQHKEEKLVRLALTALIALTAPKSAAKKSNTTTSELDNANLDQDEKKVEELEERAHEGIVKLMVSNKVVDRLMNQLVVYHNRLIAASTTAQMEQDNGHARYKCDSMMELICILLANITTIEYGVSGFLQLKSFDTALADIKNANEDDSDVEEDSDDDSDDEDWAQGYYFKKLMDMFLAQKPVYVPWELEDVLKHTRWIANIFTNLSTVPLGRSLFLKEKETDNDTNFEETTGVKFALQHMFPYLRDEDIIKRRGALCTVKNCLFVKEKHFMLRQTPLLNILLGRLSTKETAISDNSNFDTTIEDDQKFKFKEINPTLLGIVSECLVMMTATNAGMDQMSTEGVYKMFEEELEEIDNEKVKSNIRTILQRLNNRLKKKNNVDDAGELIRMEYVDDDEEGEGEGDENNNNSAEAELPEQSEEGMHSID